MNGLTAEQQASFKLYFAKHVHVYLYVRHISASFLKECILINLWSLAAQVRSKVTLCFDN